MGRYLDFRPLVPRALDTSPRLIAATLLIGWLPGAMLAALEGHLIGGETGINGYLLDPLVIAILVVLPILVVLGKSLEANTDQTVHALDRAGILPADRPPFERTLRWVNRIQTSRVALIAAWILAVAAGLPLLFVHGFAEVPTWWGWGGRISLAGVWFTLVLNAMLLYVLYTWALRGVLWAWLIVSVSRCELVLNPTHPDRCCGLMTFSRSASRYLMLLAAAGIVLAAHLSTTVYLRDLPFWRPDVIGQVATYFVLAPIIALVPLFSFTPRLLAERRRAELSLSYFASNYARALRAKIREAPADPLALDANLSGMADMYALYDNVTTLRYVPLRMRGLVQAGAFVLGPFVPLFLPTVVTWMAGLTGVGS